MKLDKLFIGNIYTLNKKGFVYGPSPFPISRSNTFYDTSFKKRTILYKKTDKTFIDLCIEDNNVELKNSTNIYSVEINEDFVMIDDSLISFKDELLKHNIQKNHISKRFVKKLTRKIK